MHAWYFYFLCHHSEYCCGFLHTVKIIHMGLKVYNSMMIFLFSFLNVMRMQKSKYAKGKIIHAMLKVNIHNYQFYLLARVRIFKSSRQDSSPVLFILRVHLSVPEMETLMVAPLVMVTLMMMSPFLSRPAWSKDFDFGIVDSSFIASTSSSFFGS